ncbi:hypothetical protein HJD18_04585 [Thermoleophilia bacterium SCSIO 60948]|nr:hypothetical protein HJD18_04585 [Thermoleophilia bacterium SCSIO 60948]
MEFDRAGRLELIGIVAGIVLILALIFLPWFELSDEETRVAQDAWICGTGEYTCTGFETFTIVRWLLIAGAIAPLILAYVLMRSHKLSWAPGEMTMVVGFVLVVLIAYNGLIAKPVPDNGVEFGTSLAIGYYIALLAAVVIGVTGYLRSLETGARQGRKAPGTV